MVVILYHEGYFNQPLYLYIVVQTEYLFSQLFIPRKVVQLSPNHFVLTHYFSKLIIAASKHFWGSTLFHPIKAIGPFR